MTTQSLQHLHFPNESADYRAARNVLLEAEMDLRRQVERVAEQRRALPPGGEAPDYLFDRLDEHGRTQRVHLAELFEKGRESLMLYSFMYGPERDLPCSGCTHFLDSLDGVARHARHRTTLFIVAKSPLSRLLAWAQERNWTYLQFLSSAGGDYDRDYFGDSRGLTKPMRKQQEFKDGEEWDMPMMNVFRKVDGRVHHFWGQELLYVPPEPGQEYRHNDAIDPLWNLFDMLPEGRGDFEPKLKY